MGGSLGSGKALNQLQLCRCNKRCWPLKKKKAVGLGRWVGGMGVGVR